MSFKKSLIAFTGVAALSALAFAPMVSATDGLDGKARALSAGTLDVTDEARDRAIAATADLELVDCVVGQAGPFFCDNVDLKDVVPTAGFGAGHGSDSWGWTAEDGTEYIIVTSGVDSGFFRLVEDGTTEYLGSLNRSETADRVLWNDVKVVNDHAYITSEDDNFGFQVVDLNAVADLPAIPLGTGDGVIAEAGFVEIGGGHNMVAFPERDIVGITLAEDATCGGGIVFFDVSDGKEISPERLGCVGGGQDTWLKAGTHDAQCATYTGPDADFNGENNDGIASDVCLMFQEEAGMYVIDVSEITRDQVADEAGRASMLTRFTYDTVNYTHQGWFSPNMRWALFNDELDESGAAATAVGGNGNNQNATTTTYWVDLTDLDVGSEAAMVPSPKVNENLVKKWSNPDTLAIDHNMYPVAVEGGVNGEFLLYQANYGAGLRVLAGDDTTLAEGTGFEQVAYFDTYPGPGPSEFYGAWNTYPFFESGMIVLSDFQSGLLVLDVADELEGR